MHTLRPKEKQRNTVLLVQALLGKRIDEVPRTLRKNTADTALSWAHNLKLQARTFPNSDLQQLKKGGLQLHNEAEPMRATVLKLTREWLQAGACSQEEPPYVQATHGDLH